MGAEVARFARRSGPAVGGLTELAFDLDVPLDAVRGYAVTIRDERSGGSATTSFDVAPHWSRAPRYGFLSDFSPSEAPEESMRRLELMLQLHLNVVQFYDWMQNHYRLVPATREYTDTLGRPLSRDVVERKIRLCHERGMAALAYGSLYGAEREFSEEHPDWLLYDGARRPLRLADLFYIQDISEGSPWREWIIAEYEHVLTELAFDGIHIDQYGFPKRALSRVGGAWHEVDVAVEFPPFVEEATRRLRALRPRGGSIFNLVNAWPLDRMPQVRQDAATYIEVWDPHVTYRDVYDLVRRARTSRPDKAVILAAYLSAFHPSHLRRADALPSFRQAFAAIHASGGSQLIAGEGGSMLTEAYYPNYGTLDDAEFAAVRRYFDFATRNVELLQAADVVDHAWTDVGPTNDFVTLKHPQLGPYGAGAHPGWLWTITRRQGRRTVLQLLNLDTQPDAWNNVHADPEPYRDLCVRIRTTGSLSGAWWDTPDDAVGRARPLEWRTETGDTATFEVLRLPVLETWVTVWWDEVDSTARGGAPTVR